MQRNGRAEKPKTWQRIGIEELAASKRFGKYKTEEQKPVREPGLKGHDEKKVEQLLEIYGKIRFISYFNPDFMPEDVYRLMLVALRKIHCTKYEVAAFCSRLPKCIKKGDSLVDSLVKPGLFISALINSTRGNDFMINTQEIQFIESPWWRIASLGYKNTKRIKVVGDVGNDLGEKMLKGEIHVLGNAGDTIGNSMRGGKIIVNGNAGDEIGNLMKGGEIRVNGEMGEFDDCRISGGRIIHKGILITGDD